MLLSLFFFSFSIYSQTPKLRDVISFREGEKGVVSGFIKNISVTKDSIWFATARGLMRIKKGENNFTVYNTSNSKISDNFITSIQVDDENLWIGTANGLSVFNIINNSWRVFKKEERGLTENYITCVLVDGNYVWIGTRTWGLNRYDKDTNEFARFGEIDGLNSNSITSLSKSGRYIWIGSEGGLNRYDKYSGEWAGFGKEGGLNLPKLTIYTLVPEGNQVWIGTIAGIYKFDSNEEKFVKHSLGTVVFSIIPDGPYLWAATFDGLYKVNKETQRLQLFTRNEGLIDNSINALSIDSNYIWVGTETPGGGVTRFDKETPQVEISGRTGYAKLNLIEIYGTIQDTSGIKSHSISYRSLLIGGNWRNEGIKLSSFGNNVVDGIIGTLIIDPQKFNEETYEVRLEAESKKGAKNIITFNMIIDKTPPKITISTIPRAVSSSTFLLEGRFEDANLESIWIKQGNNKRKAEIKLSGMGGIGTMGGGSFSNVLQLRPGQNIIEIIAQDIGKHEAIRKLEINYDTAPPEIKLKEPIASTNQRIYRIIGTITEDNLDKITLQQGNITLFPGEFQGFTIQKTGTNNYNFSFQVTLNPGKNEFTFIVIDHADRRTRATAQITFATDAPRLEIAQELPTRVTVDKYRIFGKWDDDDLNTIEISNTASGARIPAAIDSNKKTFSAEIKLSPGQNIISATAIDKAGNVTTVTMRDPVRFVTEYTQTQTQTAVAIAEGDSEEVKQIKTELLRLRQENSDLRNRILALERGGSAGRGEVIITRRTGPRVQIPLGSALYFVPYQISGGDSLINIAQDYLGSTRNYGEIAYFNENINAEKIRQRGSILVPTPDLLRMIYSSSKPGLIRKTVDTVGKAFNSIGSNQRISAYFEEILKRFAVSFGQTNTQGTIIYTNNIAVAISGLNNEIQFREFMQNKNLKTGLFVTFTPNSVYYKEIIIN